MANGASREVTWKSSDPAVKVEDGLVTAAAAANGTYTITAISKADPSKWAECQLTVDTAEHTVTVGREPGHTNSLNAVVKAYASLNDAKGEQIQFLRQVVKLVHLHFHRKPEKQFTLHLRVWIRKML